jgi:arylsulfatase A-like enzyme
MRGGKMSNWQGGIRVNAFASGGLIPQSQRGTVNSGLMVAADWYSTFCALAGVDPTDERAAVAGLPPIDSLNMWPLLSGATTVSPRAEIVVGSDSSECGFGNGTMVQALIRADGYKLIIGSLGQNIWTGPYYPNATTKWNDTAYNCGIPPNNGTGCLFNILSDPTEHVDLASTSPDIVAAMLARINEYQATAFSPNRGTDDGSACRASRETWGGFWGPFTV